MRPIIILFLTFFSLSLNNINAQVFPTYSNQPDWHVFGTDNHFSGIYQTRVLTFEKDTLMCGYTYSKTSVSPTDNWLVNFIRVDSNRVYIRLTPSCADKEFLMYDFSLSIGDTVYCGYDEGDTAAFWVTVLLPLTILE